MKKNSFRNALVPSLSVTRAHFVYSSEQLATGLESAASSLSAVSEVSLSLDSHFEDTLRLQVINVIEKAISIVLNIQNHR